MANMLARCIKPWFLIVAVCLLGGGVANAAGVTVEADALVKEGIELRRRGNDDAALRKFQKAYSLAETPRNAAQLGLCEQAVGRWSDAEKHLSIALEKISDSWISKNRDVLRESLELAKANVVRLDFIGGPPGATLKVNGQEVGNLPLSEPVKANAGQVHLSVTSVGYVRWSSMLTLQGGQYQRVVIEMARESETGGRLAVAENKQFVPMPPDNIKPDIGSREMPQAVAPEGGSKRGLWLWTGAAAVVVGLVVAAIVISSGDSSSNGTCPAGVDVCAAQN